MISPLDLFGRVFSTDGFVPRRVCGLWPGWLVWEHVFGNALVWLAYMALPLMLWRLEKGRPEWRPFVGVVRAFALFIGLCGLGHFLDMLAFYRPMYRLSGHVLMATGLVSMYTAWAIRRAWPALMAMKSPGELERIIAERTGELTGAIEALERVEFVRAYLATIVESSQDAIISKDLDGVITTWNAGAERLFGYRAVEAVGRPICFLFPEDRLDEGPTILATIRAGGWIAHHETVRLAKGGRPIEVSLSVSPIKDSAGRIIGISKIVADITERKRAEESLRRSEEQFRQLADAMPQIVWTARPDGEVEYFNRRWYDYTGRPREEAPLTWTPVIHPDDLSRCLAIWGRATEAGEDYQIEYRFRNGATGEYRWQLGRALPARDGSGRVVRWYGTCTDIDDQKAQTEALRKSEERRRLALVAARMAHWEWDVPGDRFPYQDSPRLLYDRPDDRPFADLADFLSVVHPDDRPAVRAAVELALAPGVPYEVDYRIVWPDGSVRWLAGRGGTFFDEGGSPTRMVGINLDITERKAAERQIRLLNEDLERRVRERTAELAQRVRLIDQAHDAIIVRSAAGSITSWNKGAERIYGWTLEEAAGRSPLDLLETRSRLPLAEIERELARVGSWDGELSHRRKDGVRIEVASRWVLDREASVDGAILEINSDITERKASEEALKRSELALRESQRLAGVGSWEWEPDTEVVTWSDELYRIAGLDPGGPAPRTAEQAGITTPRGLAIHAEAVAAALEGAPYEVEMEMTCGDGADRWVVARGEAVRDPDGRVVLLRGTAQDVTSRKRFEEELRQARDEAMAATGAKSEFLANMSHEIRTPMNGVLGMTELLLDTQLDDLQRRYAETIHSSGEALLTVINDILDFSKIEAGKLALESTSFDLRTLMEEVADLLAPRAHQKNLDIVSRVARDVPARLVGDPVRIRQVLTNLAGNAVKFTERGAVDLEARLVADEGGRATVRVLVRDTGIGIPDDQKALVFDSFTQVDVGNSRRHGGTGLGLAICRSLVALMGGTIGLETRQGTGSIFWFELALGKDEGESDPPAAPFRGVRVLVVDDQETNRATLREILQSWECRVDLAGSGAEALAMLLGNPDDDPFGLILLDQEMPGMGGDQAARAIKAAPRFAPVPIVMLSSIADRAAREPEGSPWAARLSKPVRRSELHRVLGRCLSAPRALGARALVAEAGSAPPPPPIRILLAEDNEVNRRVVIGMVERLGFEVEAVCNGLKAVEALDHSRHDVILMDVQMPEIDGITATMAIRDRERGTGRHVPIIALTAHAMQGDRERCLAAGMDGYISKPIRSGPLREALLAWAGEGRKPAPRDDRRPPSPEYRHFSPGSFEDACGDDPRLSLEVLGLVLKAVPGRFERLEAALATSDGRQVAWEAHDLKGEFAMVGAEALASACRELIALGEGGDFAAIRKVFRAVQNQWKGLEQEARRYLEALALAEADAAP